jgi:formylglycine-generating enzyme required for sulfatase activity
LFQNTGGRAEAATGVDTSRFPVECVSWYDALEFCNKLSAAEGRQPCYQLDWIHRSDAESIDGAKVTVETGNGYSLPTEAQWEYACRGGTTTRFNFGAANNGTECNSNGTWPLGTDIKGPALGRPLPVGSYQPNAFGLFDMHGNVWEWCWDRYDETYYLHSPESDPAGPPSGKSPVQRGGCWDYGCAYCRTAKRWTLSFDYTWQGTGFRVALPATGSAELSGPKR